MSEAVNREAPFLARLKLAEARVERRSNLRAHLPIGMFGAENMIVEVGDPLAPGGGQAQIFDPFLDVHRHGAPIKSRKFLDEVDRGFVAKLPIAADFLKLVKQ